MIPAARRLALTASGVVFTGRGLLRGWSVIETAGSTDPIKVAFYDAAATGNTTTPVSFVNVPASATDNHWNGPKGIVCEQGLSVVIVGTGTVVALFNPETRLLGWLGVFDDDTIDVDEIGAAHLLGSLLEA